MTDERAFFRAALTLVGIIAWMAGTVTGITTAIGADVPANAHQDAIAAAAEGAVFLLAWFLRDAIRP